MRIKIFGMLVCMLMITSCFGVVAVKIHNINDEDFYVGGLTSNNEAGHWCFDEGTGSTAHDSSGNGNHGSLENGVSWSNNYVSGHALRFDGSDDYVKIPDDDTLDLTDVFSISIWARFDSVGSGTERQDMIGKESYKDSQGNYNGYYLRKKEESSTIIFGLPVGGISGNYLYLCEVETGQWYHFAITRDGSGTLKGYVNGENTATKEDTQATIPTDIDLNLGCGRNNRFFDGLLDEIIFYKDRVLTAGEIQDIYEDTPAHPPNTPSTPSGPSSLDIDDSGGYSTSATDPDGDRIKYGWDWDGDDEVDYWTGLYQSGKTVTVSHSWSSTGTYYVKVKAKDSVGQQSSFSSSKKVVVTHDNHPPNKPRLEGGGDYYLGTTPPSYMGYIGMSYSFQGYGNKDPDGDDIELGFDWDGDGKVDEWIGYGSNPAVYTHHKWNSEGQYRVRVQAKDEHGALSDFSDYIKMVIFEGYGLPDLYIMDIYCSENRAEGNSFAVSAKIKNIGPGDVDKSIEVYFYWGDDPDGGIFINDPVSFYHLESGEEVTRQVGGTWPGGTQDISVICDFADILDECCESNNWRCESYGSLIKTKDIRADMNVIPNLFNGLFLKFPLLSRLMNFLN